MEKDNVGNNSNNVELVDVKHLNSHENNEIINDVDLEIKQNICSMWIKKFFKCVVITSCWPIKNKTSNRY